ncbi:hypothetical protein F4803DRAFT_557925 [Xylaria telfairii]|nr:hypothetical protein F4803DRAFT_557925 [Xylaria telfairii]
MLEYAVLRLCKKAGVTSGAVNQTSPAATDLHIATFVTDRHLRRPTHSAALANPRGPHRPPYASADLRTLPYASADFRTALQTATDLADLRGPRRPPRPPQTSADLRAGLLRAIDFGCVPRHLTRPCRGCKH